MPTEYKDVICMAITAQMRALEIELYNNNTEFLDTFEIRMVSKLAC